MQEELIGQPTIRTAEEELIGDEGSVVLPVIPATAMGRPKKLDPVVVFEAMTAAEIVERLAQSGGDVSEFCKSFHATDSVHVKMISRVLKILGTSGNDRELAIWNQLVTCHRQAITALKENQVLEMIKNLPVPDPEKTNMKDIMPVLNFWLPEYKDGTKSRSKEATKAGDPTANAVMEMLETMKKNTLGKAE